MSPNSYACICGSRNAYNSQAVGQTAEPAHLLDLDMMTPMIGGHHSLRAIPHVVSRANDHHSPVRTDHHQPLQLGPDSLDDRSRQYALLVSGVESESGERPPTYEAATVLDA